MSYSVPTWDGTATPIGEERGWMLNRWKALVDNTTTEPHPDNTDWQLVTPVSLTGVTLQTIPDPIDYLQTKVTGITITETHVNKPEEVYLGGVTFMRHINDPYLIIRID